MCSMENKTKKHAQTYFNRHALNMLYKIFHECRELQTDYLTLKEIKEIVHFGYKSIKIHFKYLQKYDLIKINGDMEIEESISVSLTEEGFAVAYLLKDIKYQSLYNANPKRVGEPRENKKHTQTYFNRHSLNIIYNIYLYLRNKEYNELSYNELDELVPFSMNSIKIHLKYLTRENKKAKRIPLLKNKLDDDSAFVELTDFGIKISRILRDIKYQSLYNIGNNRKKNKETVC